MMDYYIGFEKQFNRIGNDSQNVTKKQKVIKSLYSV